MKDDLISRQAAIDAVCKAGCDCGFCGVECDEVMALETLPSAEPSGKLIRCGECVHCADDWNGNQPMFTCELAMCGESVYPNDYCSRAERRSDD